MSGVSGGTCPVSEVRHVRWQRKVASVSVIVGCQRWNDDQRGRYVRTGGRILVDQLELHDVDLAFGVPGESYIAVLDALVDSPIRYITTRHEVGAANMAEAYGKLTGRPGICFVTRGPGAPHASG